MNIRLILILLFFCSLLTACVKPWTKPGVAPEQVSADLELCEQLAADLYPVEISTTDTSNRDGYETNCPSQEHQISCADTGGSVGGLYQQDQNAKERKRATSECMEFKGYSR